MVEVISLYNEPIWVRVTPDADFETYGYYYEIYLDQNGDRLLDWGNTYDHNEDSSLEWVCNIAEILTYKEWPSYENA